VILIQTFSFSSSDITTQFATSSTVRPQPRQTASNVVEHTAMQGVSGLFIFLRVVNGLPWLKIVDEKKPANFYVAGEVSDNRERETIQYKRNLPLGKCHKYGIFVLVSEMNVS
jgi:hypothetical protein